jgi:acetyl-CoA C-acetyltransferase/acetyl-CoA acyltransferase
MDAYIYDAVRSPRGKARPDGGLASLTPPQLLAQVGQAFETRHSGQLAEVEGLYLGCVGQVGAQGGHIALIAKLHLGLGSDAYAQSINNYCVSGLSAVGLAAQAVQTGQATCLLAGGVEMMSRVGFMADKADYYTDTDLPPALRYVQVAAAADRLAHIEQINRLDLDKAAETSHGRALMAEKTPALIASRIAIHGADGSVLLAHDETVRDKMDLARLAALAPGFASLAQEYSAALEGETFQPTMTFAHAPPVTDGAALCLVGADPNRARARIVAMAESGGNVRASLLAGFQAMDKALARAGLSLGQMDRIEFMESFGVTIVKFLRDYPVDPERVNVGGGHLAKGHPMGATGAILLSTLLDALDQIDGRYGLVVASGASGTGAALIVERLG